MASDILHCTSFHYCGNVLPKHSCLKIRQATFKTSGCSGHYRRKQSRVYYIAPLPRAYLESCYGLSFTTLRGAVTWHAIYVHSDKGTDVLDMRRVGEVLQRAAELVYGNWRISNPKSGQETNFPATLLTYTALFFG